MMNNSLMPWKTLAATVSVGVLTEGWNLAVVAMEGGEDSRVFSVEVPFASAFMSLPVVNLGLTGFDMDQRCTARISLKAVEITTTGFKVEICTWRDSIVYGVELSWLAIGA